MSEKKRKQGRHVSEAQRTKGLQLLRDGKTGPEVEQTVGVSSATVSRWRVMLRKERELAALPTPASYLAQQLEIISRLIREKLPDLAKFVLEAQPDGKAEVTYAVRQTTLVQGTVKL